MLCIGLAGLAVLAFAAHKLRSLDRAVDPGDVAVLVVFAAFGAFCALIGWRLLRLQGNPIVAVPSPVAPSKRISVSHGCAAGGVLLLILAVLVPEHWYPVVLLFAGLALLAVSHALTPCVERLEQLRRARGSMRQL